jgi:hypothetical protein
MKLFTLAVALLCVRVGFAADAQGLPRDVSAFLDRRESCDHWRGEFGYDAERQAHINWALCQACTGTDAQLARLKKKYRADTEVTERLAIFEPVIEAKDKREARRFCSKTRKPKWQ